MFRDYLIYNSFYKGTCFWFNLKNHNNDANLVENN